MTLPQDIPPDIGKLQSEMNAVVKAHWKAFLFEGIVLALLGLAAMIVPPLASLAVTIFLGWMFLIGGVAGLFATYWARQMPGFWWSLFRRRWPFWPADPARKTRAGHPHAHHRDRRVFPGRRRRHHHVRAGAPPRIVGTLVLAADLRRDGPPDRVHHRRRTSRVRRNGRSAFWSGSISCSAARRWSAWRSPRANPDAADLG